MELRVYIEAINRSGISRTRNLAKIVIEILNVAGEKSNYGISESTARTWLSDSRHCQTDRYFPGGVVDFNVEAVNNYFRKRSDEKIRSLREVFNGFGEGIIAHDGDDDEFCFNLMNPLLDFLGIPLIGLPDTRTTTTVETPVPTAPVNDIYDDVDHGDENQNEPMDEQMKKIFKQAIMDYNIASFICNLPTYPSVSKDVVTTIKKTKTTIEAVVTSDISVDGFVKIIKTDVLSRFVNEQDTETFKRINEFIKVLDRYNFGLNSLGKFGSSEIESCNRFFRSNPNDSRITCILNKKKDELKKKLCEEEEKLKKGTR